MVEEGPLFLSFVGLLDSRIILALQELDADPAADEDVLVSQLLKQAGTSLHWGPLKPTLFPNGPLFFEEHLPQVSHFVGDKVTLQSLSCRMSINVALPQASEPQPVVAVCRTLVLPTHRSSLNGLRLRRRVRLDREDDLFALTPSLSGPRSFKS